MLGENAERRRSQAFLGNYNVFPGNILMSPSHLAMPLPDGQPEGVMESHQMPL